MAAHYTPSSRAKLNRKKGKQRKTKPVQTGLFNTVAGIPLCDNLTILGIEFECNCRFSLRVQ